MVERPTATRGLSIQTRRWVVERSFCWISRNRRLAKDYERKVQSSETLIQIAMMRLLLARVERKIGLAPEHPQSSQEVPAEER